MIDRYNPDLAASIRNSVETKTLGWDVNVSRVETSLPEKAVQQGYELINKWSRSFQEENTWVRQNLGIPSLIARIDSTLDPYGNMLPYEIEERPGGIGATSVINPEFCKRLAETTQTWPTFQVVVSEKRTGFDDGLWAETVNLKNISSDKLYFVRAEPEETEFHFLEPQSISSLKEKGNKSYGVALGLWKPVNSPDQLEWDRAFALKPVQGSKSRDVRLWDPNNRRAQGIATRTKIENTLNNQGVMYQQDYFPPIELGDNGSTLYMIHRVFYGYDIGKNKWNYMGGFYNIRPSLVIHGAHDTIFGPVITN